MRAQEINSFHTSLSHPFNWRRRQKREFDNCVVTFQLVSFCDKQTIERYTFFSPYFSAVLVAVVVVLIIVIVLNVDIGI